MFNGKHPPYLIWLSIFCLFGCAGPTVKQASIYQNMSCDELYVELEKLRPESTASNQNKELNRTVDTGTTVAAQGASLAGVPYVGGALSIAKTLFNHNKQSAAERANQAENAYYSLENIAFEKGCL